MFLMVIRRPYFISLPPFCNNANEAERPANWCFRQFIAIKWVDGGLRMSLIFGIKHKALKIVSHSTGIKENFIFASILLYRLRFP